MSTSTEIRHAFPGDLPGIMALQNSYVTAGFMGMLRERPFELEERQHWFSQFSETTPHQLLIATNGNRILGYTASMAYRGGGVFSKTIKTSIYTCPDLPSKGTSSLLYHTLFENLDNFICTWQLSG